MPTPSSCYERMSFTMPSPSGRLVPTVALLALGWVPAVPPPDELDRFLSDPRPDAYSRIVERLLASPHYGERAAQHWLDVARYAESNGYEADGERVHAWRYRDYVIRSFNENKPYDRFLLEQ